MLCPSFAFPFAFILKCCFLTPSEGSAGRPPVLSLDGSLLFFACSRLNVDFDGVGAFIEGVVRWLIVVSFAFPFVDFLGCYVLTPPKERSRHSPWVALCFAALHTFV